MIKIYIIIINKATGITTQYQGTSKLSPNQFTLQDDSISADIIKVIVNSSFFIIAPPFVIIVS